MNECNIRQATKGLMRRHIRIRFAFGLVLGVQCTTALPPVACPRPAEPIFSSILRGIFSEGRMPPGSVIDAGAHLGTEACIFAEAAPERVIHALDPGIGNVQKMRGEHSRVRGHLHVAPMLAALGAKQGMLRVPRRGRKAGQQMQDILAKQLTPGGIAGSMNVTGKFVPVYRVDDLFGSQWPDERLGFFHLDVEGAELEVIRGAWRVLSRDAPVLTTELCVHHNASYTQQLMLAMRALDFDSFLVEEACAPRLDCRNLIHLPRSRRASFDRSPTLELALASKRLLSVDASTIGKHAYPCCALGGACCPFSALSAGLVRDGDGCCGEKLVGAWLQRNGQQWFTGGVEPWRSKRAVRSDKQQRLPPVMKPVTAASCDGTAYVSLLTMHRSANTTLGSTFIAKHMGGGTHHDASTHMQAKLVLVLLRSIRRVERCRREFIVLLGTEVELRPSDRLALKRAGATFRTVAPLRPGVPSMDKLHAWKLTSYSKLLIVDADVLVLQPLDALFDSADELTIAHHPYDLVQGGRCGIPLPQRAVAALMMIRPSEATLSSLLEEFNGYDARHLQHYSEQTALACWAHKRASLHTLDCSYLYDVSIGADGKGRLANCIRWSGFTAHECREVADHVRGPSCDWLNISGSVRAVHFKGKLKPWHHTDPQKCLPLRRGRLRLGSNSTAAVLHVHDQLSWRAETGVCVSERVGGPVSWATGGSVPRRCCSFHTLLQSEWYATMHGS